MQYHNNILCISGPELVQVIPDWKRENLVKRKPQIIVKRGGGTPSLIAVEELPNWLQEKIQTTFGKPEEAATSKTFIDKIVMDEKAKEFFKTYVIESSGKYLPEGLQNSYTINANILNAIKEIVTNATIYKKALGGTTKGIWNQASKACNNFRTELKHTLPKTGTTLKRKYEDYIKEGYSALINGRVGNNTREKITPEILDWVTNEMANTRQSIDMVVLRYPAIAKMKGWDLTISDKTFRNRVAAPEVQQMIQLKRHGRKGFRKLYAQTFKLEQPKYSNDLWVSDGTALNWYYREGKDVVMATTYLVMDATSNKFLGWSTKAGINKENFEMQLEAYRAALRTSGAKPYQLLYDNQGGHKNTTSRDFYSKLAHVHFPTRAYRASGKSIERAFKNFQQLKLSEFPFWTGFGRESHSELNYKPNMEAIKKNIDSLPSFEELNKLFDVIVKEWNDLGYKGEKSPNEKYAECKNPEEQPITLDELAEMFWQLQGPKKYHPHGIELRIDGKDYTYEVYTSNGDVDYAFRRLHLKEKFFIKYDPDRELLDVELYQLHRTGGYQLVAKAEPKRGVSRSVKYMNDEDRAWIDKQMKLEGDMMDKMDEEMAVIGYDEDEKWKMWRNRIEPAKELVTVGGLYEAEGNMDIID